MKHPYSLLRVTGIFLFLGLILGPGTVQSFPPAPHHLIYGMLRDEWGDPINDPKAIIYLETSSGIQIKTSIDTTEPGSNYRLRVPMDSGLTADLYKANALQPVVPFKIKVQIGSVTYLPIEMIGSFKQLGQPSKKTLLNLTLGEDTDGDGLPDAWERALISQLGGNLTLKDINPNDDSDHDGLTNLQEYLAGTYAFDPEDGFNLKIVSLKEKNPVVEFLAIRSRAYTVLGSADLKQWSKFSFRENPTDTFIDTYKADDVKNMQVEINVPDGTNSVHFFKLMVQ